MTDALANVTSFTYNTLGHRLTVTLPDPDGGGSLAAPVIAYQDDVLGRRTKETDPLGRETVFIYDTVHNLTEIRRPDHDANSALTIDTFVNDYGHRRTRHTDPLGRQTDYEYDHKQ